MPDKTLNFQRSLRYITCVCILNHSCSLLSLTQLAKKLFHFKIFMSAKVKLRRDSETCWNTTTESDSYMRQHKKFVWIMREKYSKNVRMYGWEFFIHHDRFVEIILSSYLVYSLNFIVSKIQWLDGKWIPIRYLDI